DGGGVHAGGVQATQLLFQLAALVCAGVDRRVLEDPALLFEAALVQDAEGSPARLVGRDGVGLVPPGVDVIGEIVAGVVLVVEGEGDRLGGRDGDRRSRSGRGAGGRWRRSGGRRRGLIRCAGAAAAGGHESQADGQGKGFDKSLFHRGSLWVRDRSLPCHGGHVKCAGQGQGRLGPGASDATRL